MFDLGDVPAGVTLPIFFDTYDSNGASVTMTGIAVTDVEAYKGTSMTQRASDVGYALIDTDGIDLDVTTGLQGFSIDLSDNSDAGFWAAGSFYHICLNSITVDAQTVRVTFRFRIVAAESTAGTPKADVSMWSGSTVATVTVAGVPEVDVTHFNGTAGTFLSGRPEVNTTHFGGTIQSGAIDVSGQVSNINGKTGQMTFGVSNALNVNVTYISGDSISADNLQNAFDETAGPVPWMGIVDQGTAQSATATTVVLRAASAFGDNTLIGSRIQVYGSTQGYWQSRPILDSDLATDTVTVAAWDVTPSGTISYKIFSDVGTINTVTNLTNAPTSGDLTATMKTSVTAAVPTATQVATAVRTGSAMTESFAADGAAPTLEQCLFLIQQKLCDFSISGTTLTVKKLDGTTTAATFTLDSATSPTSITRAT